MKKELSAFDLLVLTQEYQDLIGSYVDNVYQPGKDEVMLKLASKKVGKRFLRIKVGRWIWLEDECDERAQGSFSNALKKHISNARITNIEQPGFERILGLTLQKKDEFNFFLEFIPPGNIILVKDGVILRAYKERKWKDRIIKPNLTYKFPVPRLDIPRLKKSDFTTALKRSERDLVRALAVDLNLGGVYAEEVCHRGGVDKRKLVTTLKNTELEDIWRGFKELLQDFKVDISPAVIFKNGRPCDAVPVQMKVYDDLKSKQFDKHNEALAFFLSETGKEKDELRDPESERIKHVIEKQREAILKWESAIVKCQKAGNIIYQHYEEIEDILKQLRTDRTFSSPNLKDFDPAKSVAILVMDGEELKVSAKKTIHENAQIYYEKAKKAKRKLESVNKALIKSEKELVQASKRFEREKAERAKPKPRQKRFWFESFRWFISSEGFLVIGGRNAKGNEKIFRKHLKDGDRYVHADIQGAPSVVVREGSKASDATLREACQFSLANSKAWSSKLASGTAYWVKPEQVSKTPESGEYLPRGSFVIRGKRNHFRHLELVLAVGEIEYEGQIPLMCAPPTVLEKSSKKYVVFRPGDRKKTLFAKELAKYFGVSVDDILPILPPGDVEIVERKGKKDK